MCYHGKYKASVLSVTYDSLSQASEWFYSTYRQAMWDFLCRMAIPPEQGGGFCIHEGVCVWVSGCACCVRGLPQTCLMLQ